MAHVSYVFFEANFICEIFVKTFLFFDPLNPPFLKKICWVDLAHVSYVFLEANFKSKFKKKKLKTKNFEFFEKVFFWDVSYVFF